MCPNAQRHLHLHQCVRLFLKQHTLQCASLAIEVSGANGPLDDATSALGTEMTHAAHAEA